MHLNSLTFNFSQTGSGSIENGKSWAKCVTFLIVVPVPVGAGPKKNYGYSNKPIFTKPFDFQRNLQREYVKSVLSVWNLNQDTIVGTQVKRINVEYLIIIIIIIIIIISKFAAKSLRINKIIDNFLGIFEG